MTTEGAFAVRQLERSSESVPGRRGAVLPLSRCSIFEHKRAHCHWHAFHSPASYHSPVLSISSDYATSWASRRLDFALVLNVSVADTNGHHSCFEI